jgi:RNA polymerase sigma-70 factor (ECF subfamily)
VGRAAADRISRQGRGPAVFSGARLSDQCSELFRDCWWPAVAVVTRLTGDLGTAEDAVQDACALALTKWPVEGVPSNPLGWLVGVARHKALDLLRREARRAPLEAAAARDWPSPQDAASGKEELGDEELALIFMCCHPALDPEARIALTLRCVCGLATAEIAAAFVVPEPTMAQRLVRAKRKIRQAGIRLKSPGREDLPRRLAAVLRAVYLIFTQGHMAPVGPDLVRGTLCEQAIRLGRALATLIPDEPEVAGLLALLLLTDARREPRTSDAGELILLGDQDRGRWNAAKITEGTALLGRALKVGRPGPYQLHAAIAACHFEPVTDWREVAALYGELARREPTAVTEANRAVAVAMAEGPATGLAILDSLGSRLARWPQFHIARAELLHRTGRTREAIAAFRQALDLPLPQPEQAFLERRISDLSRPRAGPGSALVHAGNAELRVRVHRHLAVARRRLGAGGRRTGRGS